jgi:integrase
MLWRAIRTARAGRNIIPDPRYQARIGAHCANVIARARERSGRWDKLSSVRDWVFHDLRRTIATNPEALGVPLRVVESLSNHTVGSKKGVTRIYQRHEYPKEKRAAVDRWAVDSTSAGVGTRGEAEHG